MPTVGLRSCQTQTQASNVACTTLAVSRELSSVLSRYKSAVAAMFGYLKIDKISTSFALLYPGKDPDAGKDWELEEKGAT